MPVPVEISVVVPTYNRMDVLPRVLRALAAQTGAPTYEVIVVDDGSSDGSADWLGRASFGIDVRVVSQPNRGPAAARNRGIALASGRLVAFLGDDTIPEPGWLAAHARAHGQRPVPYAVIGYTGWHERMRVNPFLRYINEEGLQFGYALITDRENVPFNFFYSSNVSLPRELLLAERFDERFPYPAWEDIELSYRLTRRRGMRLAYCPEAVTAHDHATTLRRFMIRQEKAGYSAVLFARLHPELGGFLGIASGGPPALPPRGPQVLREWVACGAEWLPVKLPGVWEELLRYHYIRGLHRGWASREQWPVTDPAPTAPVAMGSLVADDAQASR